jgi:predicted nucleotidyltransferase
MDNIIHYWISDFVEAIQLVKYSGSRQLLETLLKFPNRQFTINELATEAGVPFASAWRLVRRWEPAGIIETGRVGKSVTVKLHKSEYLDTLVSLLRISVSPQAFTARALGDMLAKKKGVREAYLFGSVARGEEKLTSDIDVALLAEKDFDANHLVFDVYERYGTKVMPLLFSNKKELDAFMLDKKVARLK